MSDDFDPGIDGLTSFRRIGSGGFSTVYVAWEEAFSRWVAVKVLDALDEAAGRRFARERSLMGRSSGHPNVITPIRFGFTAGGKPYLVMQYMEGGSLQDGVERGERMPWRDAVVLIRPIAEALGDSHDADILHKDVKPANILLARNGSPSLTDFGIASARDTTVTQMSFTFAHSPPETFSDGADARDERSDLYSLASTLYTIIAGQSPFARADNDSHLALINRIATQPVPALGVDPLLDRFLAWAMAKDPARRPQTAAQFVEGLDRVLAGAEPGPAESPRTVLRSAAHPVPDTVASQRSIGTGDAGWGEGRDAGLPDAHGRGSGGQGDGPLPGRRPRRRRWVDTLGWAVALVAVVAAATAAWFAFGPDRTTTDTGDDVVAPIDETTDPSPTDPASPGTSPSSTGSGDEPTDDTTPPEVQQAKLLLQPGTDVATIVQGTVVLPTTAISDRGFTVENCESQLIGLQGAFGGEDLTRLRDEIAQYPSGAPGTYDDPAGADRGFRERLDAYADQFETGYRSCIADGTFVPVGPYVLGGWASIRSFLCVTGVLEMVPLPDGTNQTCPVADELALCTQLVGPPLTDFFSAFPDLAPDPAAVCQGAATDDQGLLAELSSAA